MAQPQSFSRAAEALFITPLVAANVLFQAIAAEFTAFLKTYVSRWAGRSGVL